MQTLRRFLKDDSGATAIEYGLKGIRAIAICPGFVETEMSGGKGAAERFPALVKGSCLQRGRMGRTHALGMGDGRQSRALAEHQPAEVGVRPEFLGQCGS